MKTKSIRGMNDILPEATATWRHVESIVCDVIESYGYEQIRLPILEHTEVFARAIGEVTDIVEKEMYTFRDRNDESLTMRPEATAGMVRAGITNGLFHNQRQKLWTLGPMFRYERPQKGRLRQFHQIDAEIVGAAQPRLTLRSSLWARIFSVPSASWRALGWKSIPLVMRQAGSPIAKPWFHILVRAGTTSPKKVGIALSAIH